MRSLLIGPFLNWARKLKYPTLFKIVGALFVLTLFTPDPIPLIDEILLGLTTLMLAKLKDRDAVPDDDGRTIEGQASRR